MTDYTSDPVKDVDNEDRDLDALEAAFDQACKDYLMVYAEELEPKFGSDQPKLYQDIDDWVVNITPQQKKKILDYVKAGHLNMLQFYVGGLFVEYLMKGIAGRAVLSNKGLM